MPYQELKIDRVEETLEWKAEIPQWETERKRPSSSPNTRE